MIVNFDLTITLGVLVTIFGMIVAWIGARWRGLDKRIDDQHARLDRHEGRISNLETTVKALPSTEDLHKLHLELAGFGGDVRELRQAMEGYREVMERTERVVTRHEEHLLQGTRR
ncbi:DUF2730 family protein (plasmid) [Thioclava sp. 'Guangxiensis']|uniref:DUF2730 family protein n=1 Tax=Thioclava sp. 'Guangxiensis' TaxID=3149044 RepID=UPI0032C3F0E2